MTVQLNSENGTRCVSLMGNLKVMVSQRITRTNAQMTHIPTCIRLIFFEQSQEKASNFGVFFSSNKQCSFELFLYLDLDTNDSDTEPQWLHFTDISHSSAIMI